MPQRLKVQMETGFLTIKVTGRRENVELIEPLGDSVPMLLNSDIWIILKLEANVSYGKSELNK